MMRYSYQLRRSRAQTQLFDVLARTYPVTEWECKRNQRIATVHGNLNPYARGLAANKSAALH